MNVELAVIDTSERGILVALGEGKPFWLPRSAPGVEWAAAPEIGDVVFVRVPNWIVAKHVQLQSLRFQRAFSYQAPVGLNPQIADREGSLPMANDNASRGALFRIPDDEKKNDRWPDFKGDIVIEGRRWKLTGWTKEDKNGKKYLSLVAQPFEERQPERQQAASSYAQTTGRDDRQQRPAGGPSFRDEDSIPFGPEVR